MNDKSEKNIPKYFAAANSYQGFVSYFDKIFSPTSFHQIYVLKGGPGTGKSSFMRKVSEVFSSRTWNVEEIYCSSDPSSLDGVIIGRGSKKYAIIDGTAPHARDAKIPVAYDRIINLADNLDESFLMSQRDEILSLVKEKERAYKTGYFYLSLAGKSDDFIQQFYNAVFNKFEAKIKAEVFLQDVPLSSECRVSTRLISSFSRYGEKLLSTPSEQNFRLIRIGGTEYAVRLFMDCCKEILEGKRQNITIFPNALNNSYLDGILLPDLSLAIIKSDDFDIDADAFVSILPIEQEQMRVSKALRIDSLDEARRWFAIASDLHFRLEKIYSTAMNFEKNDQLISKTIDNILHLSEKDT